MNRPILIRSSLSLAAALAVGAAASGVADAQAPITTTTPSTSNLLVTAYQRTAATKSADVTLDETATGTTSGKSIKTTVTGSGTLSLDHASPEGTLTLTVTPLGTFKEILSSTTVYLELPPSLRQDSGGKPWAAINLDQASQAALGESYSQLEGSADTASQTLAYLQAASSDVRQVGTATIHGVATTEYSTTIDFTKLATADPGLAPAVRKLEQQYGITMLPMNVWIDQQDLVRQMAFQVTAHPSDSSSASSTSSASANAVSARLTIDLFGFGTPVNATAPPASEVYHLGS